MNTLRTKTRRPNFFILITIFITIVLLIFGAFTFISIYPKNRRGLSSAPLRESRVYYIAGEDVYFKLVDDKHFVMLSEKYIFSSDKELQQHRREDEDNAEPELIFEEGSYQLKNHHYYIQIKQTTTLTFSTIKDYQKKIYYDKQEDSSDKSLKDSKVPFIVKIDGKYKRRIIIKKGGGEEMVRYKSITLSKKVLPNTIDELLTQYKYEPKELE